MDTPSSTKLESRRTIFEIQTLQPSMLACTQPINHEKFYSTFVDYTRRSWQDDQCDGIHVMHGPCVSQAPISEVVMFVGTRASLTASLDLKIAQNNDETSRLRHYIDGALQSAKLTALCTEHAIHVTFILYSQWLEHDPNFHINQIHNSGKISYIHKCEEAYRREIEIIVNANTDLLPENLKIRTMSQSYFKISDDIINEFKTTLENSKQQNIAQAFQAYDQTITQMSDTHVADLDPKVISPDLIAKIKSTFKKTHIDFQCLLCDVFGYFKGHLSIDFQLFDLTQNHSRQAIKTAMKLHKSLNFSIKNAQGDKSYNDQFNKDVAQIAKANPSMSPQQALEQRRMSLFEEFKEKIPTINEKFSRGRALDVNIICVGSPAKSNSLRTLSRPEILKLESRGHDHSKVLDTDGSNPLDELPVRASQVEEEIMQLPSNLLDTFNDECKTQPSPSI